MITKHADTGGNSVGGIARTGSSPISASLVNGRPTPPNRPVTRIPNSRVSRTARNLGATSVNDASKIK